MSKSRSEDPIETIQSAAVQAARSGTSSWQVREYRIRLFQLSLFITAIAFAALTILVKTTPSLPIDLEISRIVQAIDWPGFAALMSAVSWPGFLPQSIIITFLIVLIINVFGLRWEAVTCLLGSIFAALINLLVKEVIQRPRPPADLVDVFRILESYSFPSGHVMFYLALFGFVWFLAFSLLRQSWIRNSILGFFGGLVLLVGTSRVYLGHHWPSDVLGAYLLGSLVLVAIIYFYRWGKTRFFLDQPVAPGEPPAPGN